MSKSRTAWECECGALAYGKLPPSECSRCAGEGTFAEADEDELEELADEHLISEIRGRDWGDD